MLICASVSWMSTSTGIIVSLGNTRPWGLCMPHEARNNKRMTVNPCLNIFLRATNLENNFASFEYMNIKELKNWLDERKVKLVAVSKTKPMEAIKEVYESGQRDFGENKVQEMIAKQPLLPPDIRWHLIGHLQTNKVKYIIPFVHLIQSVDSLKLLEEINKQAIKANRIIDYLFEVYVAKEETKFGLERDELIEILQSLSFKEMKNVRLKGLMAIASNTEDESIVRKEFQGMKSLFDEVKASYLPQESKEYFTELSMGMSGDYKIAVECGATIVRIGSLIFGERNYK